MVATFYRRSRPVALALWLAVPAGAVGASEHLVPADPAAGHEIATRLCSSCHLVDERQRGPVVDGVPSFMAIADNLDDATIEALLLAASHPAMPDPPLTASDRRHVVAHIRRLEEE